MDDDYIYKRLDNIPQILGMIDRYDLNKQEVNGLQERIDDLEEQLFDEGATTLRLEDEVVELQEEINDLKRQLAEAQGRTACDDEEL